ncbi:MAG: hypothetical protein IJ295_01295 [Clostridia bacterium]|nr:hypothetical protein [Clostridia bacterium]
MSLKDLIKNANDILGLTIDWHNTSTDDNYQQLFACARLVLNSLMGTWAVSDSTSIVPEDYGLDHATVVYGILSEYAFVAGMFNEWKVWQEKYNAGLFKAQHGKSRIMPVH